MATKKTTDSTEKSTATAEKATQPKTAPASPKAMDIHPVGTAPTITTGRPVIVGNKSMANDPMLSINKPRTNKNATTDEIAAGDATTAPVISRHVKTISPLAASDVGGALEQENDAVAKSVEAITVSKAKEEESAVAEEAEKADVDASEASEPEVVADIPESAKAEPEPKETPEDSRPVEEAVKDEIDENATPLLEEETALQEKTAEQVREEQLEDFVQKKTYAVPIDKTGRRRHNAMLALLLMLAAVVVTVNFLLDFGVITIPGAPSTDIFPL